MVKTSKIFPVDDSDSGWDDAAGESLSQASWALRDLRALRALRAFRKALLAGQARLEPLLRELDTAHRPSAVNLVPWLTCQPGQAGTAGGVRSSSCPRSCSPR